MKNKNGEEITEQKNQHVNSGTAFSGEMSHLFLNPENLRTRFSKISIEPALCLNRNASKFNRI